jgi:Tol biopolymer transport system component
MISRLLCLAALISFLNSSSLAQSSSHPVTVDDYFQVKDVAEPQISSDGQWIAYTVTTATLKDDKNETRIWMIPAAGGDAIPMTAEGNSSSHPRWSPDGNIWHFLRAQRRQNASVVVGPRREAQQLTKQFKT